MTKGLSVREKREIGALAEASSDALRATVLHMREKDAKRLEVKAARRS